MRSLYQRKSFRFALVLAAMAFIFGTNHAQGSDQTYDVRNLVKSDLAAIERIDLGLTHAANEEEAQLFAKIFGGKSGRDVRRYIDERVRSFIVESDLGRYRWTPIKNRFTAWTKSDDVDSTSKDSSVAASNLGTTLWYHSLLNRQSIYVTFPEGDVVRIDSPRIGLITIGPNYKSTMPFKGAIVELPSAYRQSTLVHEARHSDCTGGVSEVDLSFIRRATNLREFSQTYTKMSCGHFHAICPSTHEFKNLPACDRHAWGAYGIETVFLSAVARSMAGRERALMNAVLVDARGRLLFDSRDMLNGKMGEPDMSSSGLRHQ